MQNISTPELLAPAGSMKSLKAAINAGADAIYLSGKNFGARQYAPNFNKTEILDALEYAHSRNIKVYVTVNTLLYDHELPDLADYLIWLYESGVDAVIVQDIGVASLCYEIVPELERHASTQMTINNTEGVKWAAELGFKRVVLARELGLNDIKKITDETRGLIELEIFTHGALCYSYSGQCLLSSVIGGRSGNRGRCAQPCRKSYHLIRGVGDDYGKIIKTINCPTKGNYLLSTRDLSLYPVLGRISRIKLDSLKIEGRMRSPEYVALVVSIYRNALDKINTGEWKIDQSEISRLKLAFNRGYTNGYLMENKGSLMGCDAPGDRGLMVGKVDKKEGKNITVNLNQDLPDHLLEIGDGLLFTAGQYKEGMTIDQTPEYINSHKLTLQTEKNIINKSNVFLTKDNSLLKEIRSLSHDKKLAPQIPIEVNFSLNKDNTPVLIGKFKGKGDILRKVVVGANFQMERARKTPITRKGIIDQLKKSGETPFEVRGVETDYPGNLFAPISKVNELRRQLLKKAQQDVLDSYLPSEQLKKESQKRLKIFHENYRSKKNKAINIENIKFPEVAVYASSIKCIEGALKAGCKRIYFEPYLWEFLNRENPCKPYPIHDLAKNIREILKDAWKICMEKGADLVWKIPSITNNTVLNCLTELSLEMQNYGFTEIMVGNMGAYEAINKINNAQKYKISGSASLNVTNHLASQYYLKHLNRITLSKELCQSGLISMLSRSYNSGANFDLIVQGNITSLVSEECILSRLNGLKSNKMDRWGLIDDKSRLFPLFIDDYGKSHILNSVELCLIDYIPKIFNSGVSGLIIDARNKTEHYSKNMVIQYNKGLELVDKNMFSQKKVKKLKEKVKKISQGGITTGNFLYKARPP